MKKKKKKKKKKGVTDLQSNDPHDDDDYQFPSFHTWNAICDLIRCQLFLDSDPASCITVSYEKKK